MTRQKHGVYDVSKALPDNHGQAQGSGLYVWLCGEVEQRFGRELVEAAQNYHVAIRYRWLIEQLEAMHSEEAAQIVEEFHRRRLADAAERRQRDRQRDVEAYQRQLNEEQSEQRRAYLAKKIEKIQRQIEKSAK